MTYWNISVNTRIFQTMFSTALEINLPAHCHLLSLATAIAHNAVA
jgi:hypothetical protein